MHRHCQGLSWLLGSSSATFQGPECPKLLPLGTIKYTLKENLSLFWQVVLLDLDEGCEVPGSKGNSVYDLWRQAFCWHSLKCRELAACVMSAVKTEQRSECATIKPRCDTVSASFVSSLEVEGGSRFDVPRREMPNATKEKFAVKRGQGLRPCRRILVRDALIWAWRNLQLCQMEQYGKDEPAEVCAGDRRLDIRVDSAPWKLQRQAAQKNRPSARCPARLQGLSNHTSKVLPAIAIRDVCIYKATICPEDGAVTVVIGGSHAAIESGQGLLHLSFACRHQRRKTFAESESRSEATGQTRSEDQPTTICRRERAPDRGRAITLALPSG